MKSIYLKNDNIKINNNCTLPEIIRLGQYNFELTTSVENFLITTSDGNNVFQYKSKGTMGNDNFDFSIDCRHWQIPYENESIETKWINSNLKDRNYPTFRRRDILSKFFILEIPDYGHQSMSLGYRDFVPHVFFEGRKLWNRYISMIRHYSKKTAYLLIDKNENNLNLNDNDFSNKIDIRICFKNNIGLTSTPYEKQSLSFVLETANGDTNYNHYFARNVNFSVYDNLNIADFDFFVVDSAGNPVYQINPIIFSSLEIKNINKKETNGVLILDKQTKNDYFKASYFKDYHTSNSNILNESVRTSDYNRDIKIDIDLKLKHNCQLKEYKKILLQSKNNYFPSIYSDTKELYGDDKFSNDPFEERIYLATTDYLYYTKDGYMIPKLDFELDSKEYSFYKNNKERPFNGAYTIDEVECIPEYNSKRRIEFTIAGLSDKISLKNLLYNMEDPNTLYRWNLKDPEVMYFPFDDNGDQYFLSNIDYNTNVVNGSYIIYDRGEELFNPVLDTDLTHDIKKNYSFSYWPNIPENYDIDIEDKELCKSICNFKIEKLEGNPKQHLELPLHYIPTSFYIGVQNNTYDQDYIIHLLENIKIYCIMRSFPINYIGTFYDGATLHFTLPPYILNNLNRDLFNSIEPYLFIDIKEGFEGKGDDISIYDIQHLSEEERVQEMYKYNENEKWNEEYKDNNENRNQAFEDSKGLYTMNILNYGNRNNPQHNPTIQKTDEPIIDVVKDERFENTYQLYLTNIDENSVSVGTNKTGYKLIINPEVPNE